MGRDGLHNLIPQIRIGKPVSQAFHHKKPGPRNGLRRGTAVLRGNQGILSPVDHERGNTHGFQRLLPASGGQDRCKLAGKALRIKTPVIGTGGKLPFHFFVKLVRPS